MLPLALAGPAEGAIALALMIAYGWLSVVVVCATIALFSRSRVAAGVAVVLAALLTLLAMPWNAFGPVDPRDTDALDFARLEKIFCGWWAAGMVVVIASALRTFVRPDEPATQDLGPDQSAVVA